MPKSPTGKRPVPRVAKDHSPSFDTSSGSYSGKRGTKTPTGSRPTPSVAKDTPSVPSPPGPGVKAPKHQAMPAPKTKWAKRGGGKPHGGR